MLKEKNVISTPREGNITEKLYEHVLIIGWFQSTPTEALINPL